jgi:hypothetical protein
MTRQAMTAGAARAIAQDWVQAHADDIPGFVGAYTAGSTNDLLDDAVMSSTSDIDVMVVLDVRTVPPKAGKFSFRGVLLEVTYLALDDVRTAEHVLSHYHLAAGLHSAVVLADVTGLVTALQAAVAASFGDPPWVRRRCEMARDTVIARLDACESATSIPERAMSWLFAAGGVPHILLVAGLRNPTVRRRYEAADELLQVYGHAALFPDLLGQFGARDLTAAQVAHHLDVLEDVFDAARKVARSPFPFAADISADARALAIDGSREMIARGRHREAMFWIVATFTRCQMILYEDAPEGEKMRWNSAYDALLADLGVGSSGEMQRSADRIRASLPPVWKVAEDIRRATTANGGCL